MKYLSHRLYWKYQNQLFQKNILRKPLKKLRKIFVKNNLHIAKCESKRITNDILKSKLLKKYDTIFGFFPMKDEVNIIPLFQKTRFTHQWFFPSLETGEIEMKNLTSIINIQKKSFGIYEPKASLKKIKPPKKILILVPALAVDIYGHRIGMGKGYYDQFLKYFLHTTFLPVVFPFQHVKYIRPDAWDISV